MKFSPSWNFLISNESFWVIIDFYDMITEENHKTFMSVLKTGILLSILQQWP